MLKSTIVTSILLGWFACWAGCGGQGGGLVPVEGVVTLDGRPLPGVQVTFDQPELSPNENTGYTSQTDEQGRFSLLPVGKDGNGALPGEFRVSLTTAVADPSKPAARPSGAKRTTPFYEEAPPPPPERIPPAYRGGKLKFTVPADGTDQANFDLKSSNKGDAALFPPRCSPLQAFRALAKNSC